MASAVVPSLNDPNRSLNRVARKVAAGPRSADEARSQMRELDEHVKAFINNNAKLTTPELVKKLQTTLESGAFETHGFDLPRGLRLIEIDTILQAAEYLIMGTASGTKVISLPGIDVFDSAQIVKDQTGSSLVLIGHSGGQGSHHPQIKVYALLPDDIRDETSNAVPPLIGDGAATFAPNRKDIIADFSLYSIAVAEHIFKPLAANAGKSEEETMRDNLVWRDGKYTLTRSLGKGILSTEYAVASCLQKPALVSEYESFLSSKSTRFITNLDTKLDSTEFSLCKVSIKDKRRSARIGRLLLGGEGKNFLVELQPGGRSADSRMIASAISKADDMTVALGIQQNPQLAAGIKSPDGGVDPALNPHNATIIEKKPEPAEKKPETAERTNTTTSIEDKIIASEKNDQTKGTQTQSGTGQKSDSHSKENGKSANSTNPNAPPPPLKNATIIEASGSVKGGAQNTSAPVNSANAAKPDKKTPAPIMIQTAPNTNSKPLAMVPPAATNQASEPDNKEEHGKSSKSKSKKSDKGNSKSGESETSNSKSGSETTKSEKSKSEKSSTEKSRSEKSKTEKSTPENAKPENSKPEKSKPETSNTEASKPSKREESTSSGQAAHLAIKSGTVRVRTGPGAEYREIGFVTKDSQFTILGEKKGWYKVRANGQVGYVLSSLVSAPGGPANINIDNDVTDQSYKGSKSSRHHHHDRDRRSSRSRHDYFGTGTSTSTGTVTTNKAPKAPAEPPAFVP